MARLVWISPPGAGTAVELGDAAVLGREAGCEVVLTDAKVSRRHAEIRREDGLFRLRDLGSRHGTYVNTDRIQERALAGGDRIQIGQIVLGFEDGGEVSQVVHEVAVETVGAPSPGADARLQLFYDLADAMQDLADTATALDRVLDGVRHVLGAERAAAGMCVPGGLRLAVRAAASASADVQIAREVQAAALSGRRALVVQEPARSDTLVRQRVRSAMAAPLLARGRVLGLLYVDDRGREGRFDERDLRFLAALGRVAGALVDGSERLRDAMAAAEAARPDEPLAELLGESAAMEALRTTVRKVAASDAPAVVFGESGTGKELVARALHALSARAEKPFVALNCAALPDGMVEAELFGHARGAFTGASQERRGRFLLAHRGTLFLDEIAELSPAAQAKLLRALQEGEVQPLGAERPVHVDVRVVVASHADLWAETERGRFREDLYYRLHVVEVRVPPLRARGGDAAALATRFLAREARKLGKSLIGFSPEASEALAGYAWPGNVRELRNEIERATILAEGPLVEVWDLSARIRGAPASRRPVPAAASAAAGASGPAASTTALSSCPTMADRFAALEPTEKALVQEALAAAKGNLSEAARLLGITRIMAKRRVDRFGLKVDREE